MYQDTAFNQNRIPLIIPSYEPDNRLLELLGNLNSKGIKKVILVDDGSGINYSSIFNEAKNKYGAIVLTHEVNKGKGAALKTAFDYCLTEVKDLIGCVTADSDGQHSPDCILKCMEALNKNMQSLVLGCRDFTQPQIPAKSVLGNKNTNKIIKGIYGKELSDTQTGLRGLPSKFIEECLKIKGNRFEYEIKMISKALGLNMDICEVPIETIYDSKDNHSTHFRPIVDTIKIYLALGLFRSISILLFNRRFA